MSGRFLLDRMTHMVKQAWKSSRDANTWQLVSISLHELGLDPNSLLPDSKCQQLWSPGLSPWTRWLQVSGDDVAKNESVQVLVECHLMPPWSVPGVCIPDKSIPDGSSVGQWQWPRERPQILPNMLLALLVQEEASKWALSDIYLGLGWAIKFLTCPLLLWSGCSPMTDPGLHREVIPRRESSAGYLQVSTKWTRPRWLTGLRAE